jgi:hypothetical protein
MHPLTVVTGILLGSALSIAVGLAVVMLIFFLLAPDYPRLGAEIGALVTNTVIFLGLTAICAASFISLVKDLRWWWIAQAGMWALLGLIVLYYIP